MNKKVNTVLFVLGATIVNMLIMVGILILGMYLAGLLLSESAKEAAGQFVFIVILLAAIGTTFFIYHRLMRLISKKVDLDKYFQPIFRRPGDRKN